MSEFTVTFDTKYEHAITRVVKAKSWWGAVRQIKKEYPDACNFG